MQRLGNLFKQCERFIETAELSDTVASVHQSGFDFFHLDLEFPDIFEPDGPERGFDAVIGNPPYHVLSEKELQARPLAAEGISYVAADLRTVPTGKNNLYKLFICRFVELLRDGGRLGVIVPMALLGDDISTLIRRMLVEQRFIYKNRRLPTEG